LEAINKILQRPASAKEEQAKQGKARQGKAMRDKAEAKAERGEKQRVVNGRRDRGEGREDNELRGVRVEIWDIGGRRRARVNGWYSGGGRGGGTRGYSSLSSESAPAARAKTGFLIIILGLEVGMDTCN
jgi:hypothetical protein